MDSKFEEFLADRGLGPVERRLRLGGKLSAAGAGELSVELCLTPQGAFLVAADGRFLGLSIDVAEPGRLRYERGSLRDRLLVDGRELQIPTGRGAELRRAIALGRLRRDLPARPQAMALWPRDRYLELDDEPIAELAWRSLAQDDALIALCRASENETQSALGATVRRHTYFALSAERALLVSLSELGDREVLTLDEQQLRLDPGPETLAVSDGSARFSIGDKSRALFAELLELARLPAAERLCEAARRLWLARDGKPERPSTLVAAAIARGHALAGLLALALSIELEHPLPARADFAAAVAAVRAAAMPTDELTRSFRRWQFSSKTGRELVAQLGLLGAEAEPCALAVHRAAYDARGLHESTLVLWDVELAEHELRAGEAERAQRLAEKRLKALAPDEDAVLSPERATSVHLERVRLYELLSRAASARGATDVRALAALARLEPASEARLLGLARADSTDAVDRRFIQRAEHTLSCLSPGGLDAARTLPVSVLNVPLDRAALDQRVRHPLARGSGRFAARLSELIASVPEPDLSFLRDFCEELTEAHYPDASRALARAASLLGLPPVAAYVSHGARSVGLRAFGSREPFVLIGERHLSAEGPYTLRGPELDFALGAELCHLAFDHQRVTAGEVWAGAAGKTRDALVLLGFALPAIAELGGPRAQRLLGKLSAEALERAAGRAARLPEFFGRNNDVQNPALGQRNEELIAAHRLVQLTADRGGLVVAGSLAASLRAVLLTRADYREVLDAAQERGLLPALAARRTASPAFANLLVRVRALIAFYLSPDFDALAGEQRENAPLTS